MGIEWTKIFEKPEIKHKIEGQVLIDLKTQLNEVEDKLLVNEVMLKKVRKENKELVRFMDDYQTDISGLNKKLEFKSKNLDVLLEIKLENQEEIEKLKSEKAETEKQKSKLEKQVASSSENSSTLEEILSNKDMDIEKLKSEIKQIKEDRQEEKNKLREKMEQIISEKTEKLEELKKKLDRADLELEKMNFEKEKELERLKQDLERANLNTEKANLKSEQIRTEVQGNLNHVIIDKDKEVERLQMENNAKEQEILKTKEILNSLKSQIISDKKDSHILEIIMDSMKIKGFISDKELNELLDGFEQEN